MFGTNSCMKLISLANNLRIMRTIVNTRKHGSNLQLFGYLPFLRNITIIYSINNTYCIKRWILDEGRGG